MIFTVGDIVVINKQTATAIGYYGPEIVTIKRIDPPSVICFIETDYQCLKSDIAGYATELMKELV